MSQSIDVQSGTGVYSTNGIQSNPGGTFASGVTDFLSGLSQVIVGVGSAIVTERQVEAAINQANASSATPSVAATITAKASDFIRSPLGVIVLGAVALLAYRKFRKG